MLTSRTIGLLFALLVLTPSILRLRVIVDFALRNEYIATVLCINKDVPEMNCDGKCYLAQQFQKAADNEQKERHTYLTNASKVSFYLVPETLIAAVRAPYMCSAERLAYERDLWATHVIIPHFHPPRRV